MHLRYRSGKAKLMMATATSATVTPRSISQRCSSSAKSTRSTKVAKTSVLELLTGVKRTLPTEPPTSASPVIETDKDFHAAASVGSVEIENYNSYVAEVTVGITEGRIELRGSPWVMAPCPLNGVQIENAKRRAEGRPDLNSREILAVVTRLNVFVWAPEYLSPDITIVCPSCRSGISEKRWHPHKFLHGMSQLALYVTREYTCSSCTAAKEGKHQRPRSRKSFLADTSDALASLPACIRQLWQLHNTGRTLCESTVVDYIRAMATKTSWSAIAECINEVRETAWTRNVSLPYYQLCEHLKRRPADESLVYPSSDKVTAQWVRNLYMADWHARQDEVQEELHEEKGTDILAVDWTRDAAARCGRQWLFNAMDGRHSILCSGMTTNCDPASAMILLRGLAERGVEPRVMYVDSECCGAWPPVVQQLWPSVVVKLDGMHAIRRLTKTTSSTQHPWHARFCQALSAAIYKEDAQVVKRIREARSRAGLSEHIPKRTKALCIPRTISNAPRIVEEVEAVLRNFQTPSGQNGSLITNETWAAWENLKQHVAAGCLCDPPGVSLNVFGQEQVVDGVRLPTVCKARGASALEGFHTHQKSWLGCLARHAGDAGDALLADGALRWNRRVRENRDGDGRQSAIFACGLRRHLEAARNSAKAGEAVL